MAFHTLLKSQSTSPTSQCQRTSRQSPSNWDPTDHPRSPPPARADSPALSDSRLRSAPRLVLRYRVVLVVFLWRRVVLLLPHALSAPRQVVPTLSQLQV